MVQDKFWVNFDMFGIKKHVLKLRNWMVTLKQWLEPNQNQTKQIKTNNMAKTMGWDKFWSNFDMFGIKKYELKLKN